jgi:adhesin/invasin
LSLATSPLTLSSATMKAGTSITVTLQPEDAGGNKLLLLGETVIFAIANGQPYGTTTYNSKTGTYSATFTTTTAGSYQIEATINGLPVTSIAPVATVTPAAVNLANSFVAVGANTVVAGSSITVTLQARDAFGNNEANGGLAVAFKLGTGTGKGTFSAVKDNKNGTYTATFVGTIAGSNSIVATMAGLQVSSTAPAITVTPGAVSLAKSTVTLSSSVSVGGTIEVILQARDAFGNNEASGGLPIVFFLGSTSGGQGTFGSVIYNGNGTYTATFTALQAGANTIEAKINGQLLTSTPARISISSI